MLKRALFIALIISVLSLLTLGSKLEDSDAFQNPVVILEPVSRGPASVSPSMSETSRMEIVPIPASEL